jgi:hypothetical protein
MRRKAFGVLLVVAAMLVSGLGVANADPGGKEKVEICHVPPGNPGQQHTITVGEPAVDAHLAHGDERGECDEERPGRDDDAADRDDEESPIARAGDDQCVFFDDQVQLDGRDSSDPDGDDDDLEFMWDFDSTPPDSDLDEGDLSDDEDDNPTFTPDQVGLFRLELEVTDPDDNSDTDTVNIRVTANVGLDENTYDVDEGDTTPVEISLAENAPTDITVDIEVDDPDVAVVVPESDDDESDQIPDIEIEEGEDSITVYVFGVEEGSTEITVSVGTDQCGDEDSADVDVDDSGEAAAAFQAIELSSGGLESLWIPTQMRSFIQQLITALLSLG